MNSKKVGWPVSPVMYAIGALPQFKHDGDFFDWLYLSMRWLPLVRPLDMAVLPDLWPLREYVRFLEDVLHQGSRLNILWVSAGHYVLDDALDEDTGAQKKIRAFTELHDALVVTYSSVSRRSAWFKNAVHEERFCGESEEWCARFGSKEILHPSALAPEVPSLAESMGVPVLRGYNASNTDELLRALQLLSDQGIANVGIKPLSGVFGDGIVSLEGKALGEVRETLRAYQFPGGPVALEEWVKIDQDDHGERSWSTHYLGNSLFGPPTRQLVSGRTSAGNITPGFPENAAALEDITARLIAAMSPKGMGGFNGPMVDGKPYMTDVNTGRLTGVCSSLAFRELLAPGMVTLNRKLGKPMLGLRDAWQRLRSEGLAFDPSRGQGVFLQGWIPSAWSQVIVAAGTRDEVVHMLQHAKTALA